MDSVKTFYPLAHNHKTMSVESESEGIKWRHKWIHCKYFWQLPNYLITTIQLINASFFCPLWIVLISYHVVTFLSSTRQITEKHQLQLIEIHQPTIILSEIWIIELKGKLSVLKLTSKYLFWIVRMPMDQNSNYKLIYFDCRALAEPVSFFLKLIRFTILLLKYRLVCCFVIRMCHLRISESRLPSKAAIQKFGSKWNQVIIGI
jgi:hypothetical protein